MEDLKSQVTLIALMKDLMDMEQHKLLLSSRDFSIISRDSQLGGKMICENATEQSSAVLTWMCEQ